LHDRDDKLLLTVTLPSGAGRLVRLQCYPSSMAGGYRPGRALRHRHSVTAVREIVLGDDDHARTTELTAGEPWALFMDDHFDAAEQRGRGPCAALYLPHEVSEAVLLTGNYACRLDLRPLPETRTLHLALWEFPGLPNAEAVHYMRGIELVHAQVLRMLAAPRAGVYDVRVSLKR
jgi:hypothetical protein